MNDQDGAAGLQKSRKIAFVSASMRGGGAERSVLTLASCMVKKGYAVDLVLVSKEGPYLDEISPATRIIDLQQKRAAAALLPLIRYIRRERPAFVISTMSHVNIITLLASIMSFTGCKAIVREVTNMSTTAEKKFSLKGLIIGKAIRWLYRQADQIVAVSKGVADSLVRGFSLPPEKIKVFYDPVVTEDLAIRAGEPVYHPWFSEQKIPIILAAGRLSREKDYPTLLKAFSLLYKEIPARLVVLGEGTERKALEDLVNKLGIEEVVSFPGFVLNPFPYMKRADVFTLTSIFEGLSNVLVQAMAVGTTVISTNCPSGPAEVLEDGKYGALVSVGDAEALKDALKSGLSCPTDPNLLKEGTLRFLADKICDDYTTLFEELSADHHYLGEI